MFVCRLDVEVYMLVAQLSKMQNMYSQRQSTLAKQESMSETGNVSEKMTKQRQPEESMAEVEPVAIKDSNALEETGETHDKNIP